MSAEFQPACPIPLPQGGHITLAHGGGGRRMRDLIEGVFLRAFGVPPGGLHDGTEVDPGGCRVAITTDSFVVHPLFFPGGDIGKLAVLGTVNDLAMCGATPRWMSAGFILEEGLSLETLERVVRSMALTADACGVRIVTGDTKVVDRGKGDGIYINTTGLGLVDPGQVISPSRVEPGDAILLSGDVGRHGIAVLSVREGLQFETVLESDCASLAGPVRALLDAGVGIHCLRDLTRGGLASALNEIADAAGLAMEIDENVIPVCDAVRAACELLGLDPLYVANEGRFVAFVPPEQAVRALEVLKAAAPGQGAALVGSVQSGTPGQVILRGRVGQARVLDLLSGEQLPRIC